jgi:hypothetical protein
MRVFNFIALGWVLSPVLSSTLRPRQNATVDPVEEISSFVPSDEIAELASAGLAELLQVEDASVKPRSTQCSLKNVAIRRDWYV